MDNIIIELKDIGNIKTVLIENNSSYLMQYVQIIGLILSFCVKDTTHTIDLEKNGNIVFDTEQFNSCIEEKKNFSYESNFLSISLVDGNINLQTGKDETKIKITNKNKFDIKNSILLLNKLIEIIISSPSNYLQKICNLNKQHDYLNNH